MLASMPAVEEAVAAAAAADVVGEAALSSADVDVIVAPLYVV